MEQASQAAHQPTQTSLRPIERLGPLLPSPPGLPATGGPKTSRPKFCSKLQLVMLLADTEYREPLIRSSRNLLERSKLSSLKMELVLWTLEHRNDVCAIDHVLWLMKTCYADRWATRHPAHQRACSAAHGTSSVVHGACAIEHILWSIGHLLW